MTALSVTMEQIFNQIPLLESAAHLDDDHLRRIGNVFINHNQHNNWGICRVHRHHDLNPDEIMVHKLQPGETVDICKVENISRMAELHPHSWHFSPADELIPYEYSLDVMPNLSEEFKRDLYSQLRTTGLLPQVSLIPIEQTFEENDQKWLEFVNNADRTMISISTSRLLIDPGFETVGWRFRPGIDGEVEVIVLKECRKHPQTGVHHTLYEV
ncbi:hypothetical protein D6D28_10331 [Aureobasidium pullulans]|uniref:Uncharacterized protein n=1 Tax=Aureobasidium pullulans TaxID=5580 RepID=A0A4S8S068_AURPU|nr:hypothetical protein D6D28_10331 [Aureobasidium pullulans]